MTPTQIKAAKNIYLDWFASDMSERAVNYAANIESVDDLYTQTASKILSDGEIDALEAAIEGR